MVRSNLWIAAHFLPMPSLPPPAAVSVNGSGSACPPALQLVAVQLLLEITAFLRDTYATLPKQGA